MEFLTNNHQRSFHDLLGSSLFQNSCLAPKERCIDLLSIVCVHSLKLRLPGEIARQRSSTPQRSGQGAKAGRRTASL
jgi:hypothetical protein